MKKIAFILLLIGLWVPMASADIIETKKMGALNGKILSQDDREVRFLTASGKEHVFSKEDVLYLEKDSIVRSAKINVKRFIDWASGLWGKAKVTSDKMTSGAVGAMSKPLDRSAADRKSQELAGALSDATQASGAMISRVSTANKEIYTQSQHTYGTSSSSKNKEEGRFAALD